MIVNRIGKIFITIPHFSCKKCQKFAPAPPKNDRKTLFAPSGSGFCPPPAALASPSEQAANALERRERPLSYLAK